MFAAFAAGLAPGCQPDAPLARAGVHLSPPASWRPVARTTWPVPGTPLAAWSGPNGSSLVVYRALPIPDGNAKGVAEALANRLSNLPGLELVVRRTEEWGKAEAGRVEAVAPGTGDSLAPSGTGVPAVRDGRELIPTRRVVLGFPRASAPIFLAWHAPESANAELQEQVQTILQGLRLDSPQARHSSY